MTSSDLPTPVSPITVILKLSRMRLGLAGRPLSRGADEAWGAIEGDETLSMLTWPSRDERLRMLETAEPGVFLECFMFWWLCLGRGDSMPFLFSAPGRGRKDEERKIARGRGEIWLAAWARIRKSGTGAGRAPLSGCRPVQQRLGASARPSCHKRRQPCDRRLCAASRRPIAPLKTQTSPLPSLPYAHRDAQGALWVPPRPSPPSRSASLALLTAACPFWEGPIEATPVRRRHGPSTTR